MLPELQWDEKEGASTSAGSGDFGSLGLKCMICGVSSKTEDAGSGGLLERGRQSWMLQGPGNQYSCSVDG